MNCVGQVIQMDGTGITTCLIVGRRKIRDWEDLWDWEIIVLDYIAHPNHVNSTAVHLPGDKLILNNQYIEKYSWPVT